MKYLAQGTLLSLGLISRHYLRKNILKNFTSSFKPNFAQYIDHTVLKPEATEKDIAKLCEEAKTYGFKSVCVNSYNAPFANKLLGTSDVKLCIVVGFPLGANLKEVKAFETRQAISNGAKEIDMVINVGALKDKKYEYVQADILGVVQEARKTKEKTIVKVILETCLLTEEETTTACKIVKDSGADFVKTSTGFSKAGADPRIVKLMRDTVGKDFGVKASGGIRTKDDFLKMIEAGANRIGASSSIDILNGLEDKNTSKCKITPPKNQY